MSPRSADEPRKIAEHNSEKTVLVNGSSRGIMHVGGACRPQQSNPSGHSDDTLHKSGVGLSFAESGTGRMGSALRRCLAEQWASMRPSRSIPFV